MTTDWIKKQREEIQRILEDNKANRNFLNPLTPRHVVNYFEPLRYRTGIDVTYLQMFELKGADSIENWKEIGWGQDRDIGRWTIVVNMVTGRLAEYSHPDYYPPYFSTYNCTLQEVAQLNEIMRDTRPMDPNLLEFLQDKLSERLVTFPLVGSSVDPSAEETDDKKREEKKGEEKKELPAEKKVAHVKMTRKRKSTRSADGPLVAAVATANRFDPLL